MVEFKERVTPIAPSQAHLQGTQSRHTEANLAKEPALFPRFLDTPYFGGHIRYSDTPERRANVQQGVWQNTGGRKPCFNFWVILLGCISNLTL